MPPDAVALLSLDDGTIAKRGSLEVVSVAGRRRFDARLVGATRTSGIAGRALRFSDTDSFVHLGYPAVLRDAKAVSVSAWVRVKTFADSNYIVSSEDWDSGNTRGFTLRVSGDGKAEFAIGNEGWRAATGSKLRTGRWFHLVGTASETEVAVWVDGSRAGRADSAGG